MIWWKSAISCPPQNLLTGPQIFFRLLLFLLFLFSKSILDRFDSSSQIRHMPYIPLLPFPNIARDKVIMLRSVWWRPFCKVCHGAHLFLRDSELAAFWSSLWRRERWRRFGHIQLRPWGGHGPEVWDFSLQLMGYPFVWSAACMHIQVQEAQFYWNRMIIFFFLADIIYLSFTQV